MLALDRRSERAINQFILHKELYLYPLGVPLGGYTVLLTPRDEHEARTYAKK